MIIYKNGEDDKKKKTTGSENAPVKRYEPENKEDYMHSELGSSQKFGNVDTPGILQRQGEFYDYFQPNTGFDANTTLGTSQGSLGRQELDDYLSAEQKYNSAFGTAPNEEMITAPDGTIRWSGAEDSRKNIFSSFNDTYQNSLMNNPEFRGSPQVGDAVKFFKDKSADSINYGYVDYKAKPNSIGSPSFKTEQFRPYAFNYNRNEITGGPDIEQQPLNLSSENQSFIPEPVPTTNESTNKSADTAKIYGRSGSYKGNTIKQKRDRFGHLR